MNPIVLFGACAAGLAVEILRGVIFFVILDDGDRSKRLGHLYQFLGVFTGLGGGPGVVFGFIDFEVLPVYIGVVAVVLAAFIITSLVLKRAEWF